MLFSVFGCYSGFDPIYPDAENLDLISFDCTCHYVGVTSLKHLIFWSKRKEIRGHVFVFLTSNNCFLCVSILR